MAKVIRTILLEWTSKNPEASTYDGGQPREIFRTAKPFQIHNGGQLAFNPLARPGSADYGLLSVGVADGGNGGDPYKHAQNLAFAFGKFCALTRSARTAPTASTVFLR